jgi:hypothetical protein
MAPLQKGGMAMQGNFFATVLHILYTYRCADKSLARTASSCIFFDGENISFDASLVIYMYI